jgi:antitoxin component YwqK of YwqJK toxin-antitoxin module
MKSYLWMLTIFTSLMLLSCSGKNNQSGVVSQQFVHKYGFAVSEEEWEEREKDGKVISELDNGVVLTQTYSSGTLNGPTTYTFPLSKTIEELDMYDDGALVKKVIYDNKGVPIREDLFEYDDHKVITLWNYQGVPISVEEYEKDLLWNGKYFTPENDIESTVENGYGIRTKRDRAGLLVTKDKFDNGILTNRSTYHPNGQIQTETPFLDYKIHGEQLTFTTSGKPLMKMFWTRGVLNGNKIVYRNGNKQAEIPYVNGNKHGLEKHYNDQGSVVAEVHWENDQKHGSSHFHDEDNTDIDWFYKGKAVSLKKFEMLEYRDQLMADLLEENDSLLENSGFINDDLED